jgi:hypothetical protein
MGRGGIRARWAVPAGAVAVVGIVIAASAVASAQGVPSLPSRTAAQLLAEMAQAGSKPLGPLTATVQETSNLGLPQLPAAFQQNGAGASPLAGSQSVSIWYRDAQHLRLALPVQAGETDYRLNGRTLWVWDSKTQTATDVALPAHVTFPGNGAAATPGLPPGGAVKGRQPAVPGSPMAAANQVLKAVGPTTAVSVQRNLYVAGQAAYQLALVPRSSQSLVGRVLIAIDAARHIPLRVQVFARGSSAPAYSVGFTALSFGTPAASNFSFTPPAGATVKKETAPASLQSLLPAGVHAGLPGASGFPAGSASAVAGALGAGTGPHGSLARLPEKARAQLKAQFARNLPASMPKAKRAAILKTFEQGLDGKNSTAPGRSALVPGGSRAGAPKVIGTSWLSVLATPASPQVAAAVQQLLSSHPGPPVPQSATLQASSSNSAAYSSTLAVAGPPGQDLAVLRELLKASNAVHGSWGSGRLLQTRLLSVLVTSDGRILAGAVSPAVLYRDVALDAG